MISFPVRKKRILEELAERGAVEVQTLAEMFAVARMTVRRDLAVFANA